MTRLRLLTPLLFGLALLLSSHINAQPRAQLKQQLKVAPIEFRTFGHVFKQFGQHYDDVLRKAEKRTKLGHVKQHHFFNGRRAIEVRDQKTDEWYFYYFESSWLSGFERIFTDPVIYRNYCTTFADVANNDYATTAVYSNSRLFQHFNYNPVHQVTNNYTYYNTPLNCYLTFGALHNAVTATVVSNANNWYTIGIFQRAVQ